MRGLRRSRLRLRRACRLELFAAFLRADLGITNDPRPDHAQYIAQYLEILQNDTRAIFQAATAASAAADYILAFSRPQQVEAAA